MLRKIILPVLLCTILCVSFGCKYSDNDGWSGNVVQSIGVTGTYYVFAKPDFLSMDWITFTQIENVVEAFDNNGNKFEGSATQDLVVAESDPDHQPEDTKTYYARTIAVNIIGTLSDGATAKMVLTVIYGPVDNAATSLFVDPLTNAVRLPNGLQGQYTDDRGRSGYIEFWKAAMEIV